MESSFFAASIKKEKIPFIVYYFTSTPRFNYIVIKGNSMPGIIIFGNFKT